MKKSTQLLIRYFRLFTFSLVVVVCLGAADGQTADRSDNAALHYNRAMLQLTTMPMEDRELLAQPVFLLLGDSSKEEITKLVAHLSFSGRHAIRSARIGCQLDTCKFGIDYADTGRNSMVPHATYMLHLSRLMTIAGINEQIDGNSAEAAELFFDCLQIGKHLASEPTLVETLVGIEVVENACFSLAFWGTRCSDSELIAKAFARLNAEANGLVDAEATFLSEARLFDRQIASVAQSFPDGNWAERILEAWGELVEGTSHDEARSQLMASAGKRGIAREVFKDRASFAATAKKFRDLHVAYLTECSKCMALQEPSRSQAAQKVYDEFKPKFDALGDAEMLDVREVAGHVATHEAEVAMARVALALAASRQSGNYPSSLSSVKALFNGEVPTSPYDGEALEYSVLGNGSDFSLVVPERKVGDVEFPRIEFSSVRKTDANP